MKKGQRNRILIFLATIIFVIGGTLVTIRWAKGYRPTKNGTVKGTGLLAASSSPKGAQVYIEGKLTTATDDTLNLNPGAYDIRIKKDGYHEWQKTLTIKEELVTQTNATLFPTVPSFSPITFSGSINPTPSPDGQKIAFAVASASASTKNGLYIQELSSNPLSLNRSPHQIARNTPEFDFEQAEITWSPDSSQLITSFPDNTRLLLESNSLNQSQDFRDITVRLPLIFQDWEEEIAQTETANFKKLNEFMTDVATKSAVNVYISPDKEKMLYQPTKELTIPEDLVKPLPSSSTQKQERDIKPGNYYVYDMEEDKNFLILENTLSQDLPQKTLLLESILPSPSFKNQESTDSAQAPLATLPSVTKDLSTPEALQNISTQYSGTNTGPIQWFPDSYHLVITTENGIDIIEYDSTNRTTVFSGSFDNRFVFPWPDGSQIITLLQFSPNTPSNLYAIKLK